MAPRAQNKIHTPEGGVQSPARPGSFLALYALSCYFPAGSGVSDTQGFFCPAALLR